MEQNKKNTGNTDPKANQQTSGKPGYKATETNADHQNIAPNRGGTTDMSNEQTRNDTGNTTRNARGSGVTTKHSVTGSDYDGQVSEQS